MSGMRKHFVTFRSPGTFTAEEITEPINSWDVGQATEMAHDIIERHGAIPYAFFFTTRTRKDTELDSKETQRSGQYFLGGTVLTLQEVKDRNDPQDRILISNMEHNGWDRIVENCNPWKVAQNLGDDDVVLAFTPKEQTA
jgi:hypothetical protein